MASSSQTRNPPVLCRQVSLCSARAGSESLEHPSDQSVAGTLSSHMTVLQDKLASCTQCKLLAENYQEGAGRLLVPNVRKISRIRTDHLRSQE